MLYGYRSQSTPQLITPFNRFTSPDEKEEAAAAPVEDTKEEEAKAADSTEGEAAAAE
jgi:hypothetical protein